MANSLGVTTLKVARSDLRSRLAEASPRKFVDDELDRWLNVGQLTVFSRLRDVIGFWYADNTTTSGEAPSTGVTIHALVSPYDAALIASIDAVVGVTADINTLVFQPADDIHHIYNMLHNSHYDNHTAWLHNGDDLIYFIGSGLSSLTSSELTIFYTLKPVLPGADGTVMDIPEEYIDLVIMVAQSKALAKLNLLQEKRLVDTSVNEAINDVLLHYQSGSQMIQLENQPGTQTMRGR